MVVCDVKTSRLCLARTGQSTTTFYYSVAPGMPHSLRFTLSAPSYEEYGNTDASY